MNAKELNTERKRLGLSFEELAKKSNLPKSTIEKVLFGVVKNPRIDTIIAIEKALNLSQNTLTKEEITSGAVNVTTIPVNGNELHLIELYREAIELEGEIANRLIINFLESYLATISKKKD